MAIGKKLGSFRAQSTSTTLTPGKGSMPNAEINYEGTVTGELDGSFYSTMNFSSKDARTGTYTLTSLIVLANGEIIGASGRGSTTHKGGQKWEIVGVSNVNNTNSFGIKGIVDLEERSMKGDLFDRE